MKRSWLVIAAFILLVGSSVWLNLMSGPASLKAPPAMTDEQILATPETQVVSQVTTDLRWKLAELDASQFGRWRTLPAEARHVLALGWVERDDGPGHPVFNGFASLLANTAPNMATLAEIAEAYDAIGACEAAAVVTQAAQLAISSGFSSTAEDAARSDPFTALNRQLLSTSSKSGVVSLLRAYIRRNAAEIASARFGG